MKIWGIFMYLDVFLAYYAVILETLITPKYKLDVSSDILAGFLFGIINHTEFKSKLEFCLDVLTEFLFGRPN